MYKKEINKTMKIFTKIFIVFFIFFLSIQTLEASTEVYLQNDTKNILVGDIFEASLKISSGEMINAIDGIILYDKAILEIKEINMENSLFSMWLKEPTFDNKKGELSFIGGIPNGYSGKDGQVLEIIFFTKKSGETKVTFNDIFSVFANDGKGTKIDSRVEPLTLSIKEKTNNYFWLLLFLLPIFYIIINMLKKFRNKKNEK